MESTSVVILVFALLITVGIASRKRSTLKNPPGPPQLPIVGNLLNFPRGHDWIQFQKYSKEFNSDLLYFRLFWNRVVVVNSAKAARDLFEKRSNVYSDREKTVMVYELTGWHRNIAVMEYGDRWRMHRRNFHQYFRPDAIPNYHPRVTLGVHRLLNSLLETPEEFATHIRFMSGSTTLDIVYAIDPMPKHDPILEAAEEGVECLSEIINAGSYLVDSVPILKYLPEWFPGAEFKRQAARWKEKVDALHLRPYEVAKKAWDSGNAKPCIATTLLENLDKAADKADYEDMVINVTAMAFQAGTDTTVLTLTTFVLAMLMFPECQKAAREEIDRVVGRDRLPEFSDRESMPYITAMAHEVLRWHPAVPLAVPHKTSTDDTYEGYFIPKGTIIVGNSYAILRDEKRYPNPEVFDPTRFLTKDGKLNPDVPDPTEAFGFGRRICAGRHFADHVLWLTIAKVLAVFHLEEPLDAQGRVVKAKEDYTTGMFSMPKNLKATFKPRSSDAAKMIRASLADA